MSAPNAEKTVLNIISKYVEDKNKIDQGLGIKENGIDSFEFIQCTVEIEQELKVKIDDEKLDLSEFATLGDFVKYVTSLL